MRATWARNCGTPWIATMPAMPKKNTAAVWMTV